MTSAAALRQDPVWRGRGDRTIRACGRAKAVDDRELALIRSFALRAVDPAEVRVYEARVANNRVDRDQERFSEEILADFAETLVGKSVCIAHQWGPPGVGRVHRAELVEEDGTLWLRAAFFIPVLGNEKLLNDLDLGVVTYVSIGFAAPERVEVAGRDGQPVFWEYRRGPNGERGEAFELSLVFLGAQYDSAVVKSVLRELRRERPEGVPSLERALAESVGAPPEAARGGRLGRFLGLVGEAARVVFGAAAVGEGAGPEAGPGPAGKEEDGAMDAKVLEEIRAELARIAEEVQRAAEVLRAVRDELEGLKRAEAELRDRTAGLGEDVTVLEEAGLKVLERVEALERAAGLGAARAEPVEEDGDAEPPRGARRGGSATEVFGLMITPEPLRGRRAAALLADPGRR